MTEYIKYTGQKLKDYDNFVVVCDHTCENDLVCCYFFRDSFITHDTYADTIRNAKYILQIPKFHNPLKTNGYDYRYIKYKCGHENNMFCTVKFIEECKEFLCEKCREK